MDNIGIFMMPFRRGRSYVQGAELCDAMLDALPDEISNLSWSIHHMIHTHRSEMCALNADELTLLLEFPVRLRAYLGGEPRYFGLRPLSGDVGIKDLDDHEAQIWGASWREKNVITCDGPFPLTPLSTAVSLKKRLMRDLFPEQPGKWIFCRLDAIAPPPESTPRITVRFVKAIRSIYLSEVVFGAGSAARMSFMVRE